eukprot:scaffold222286_cov126-Cyclotella_meneghiniana.AAC.1
MMIPITPIPKWNGRVRVSTWGPPVIGKAHIDFSIWRQGKSSNVARSLSYRCLIASCTALHTGATRISASAVACPSTIAITN